MDGKHRHKQVSLPSLEPIRKVKLRIYNLKVMDNIYDEVVPRLEGPDLGQDHEGSLQQPPLCPAIWSGSELREGGLYNLTALLPFSTISELDISS